MEWYPAFFQLTHDFRSLPFRYQELCQVVKITPLLSGNTIRLRLTNRFGRDNLTFNSITIANNPVFKDAHSLKRNGNARITLLPYSVVKTDPLKFQVIVGKEVYVKMTADVPQIYTDFACAYNPRWINAKLSRHQSFIPQLSRGWHNRKGWFSLEGLEVLADDSPTVYEITGDSLVESGMVTEPLFKQTIAKYPGKITWVNTGISGNQLLNDAPVEQPLYETFGEGLLERLTKRVPLWPPQKTVAIIGSNDLLLPYYSKTIGGENVTALDLADGFQKLYGSCKMRGSSLLTTTIAPIRLFDLPNPRPQEELLNRKRNQVNQYLRNNSWVIDGSRILTDTETGWLAVDNDFGDHLHLSPDGGRKLAKLFEKELFK